jgi:hypothetical protein
MTGRQKSASRIQNSGVGIQKSGGRRKFQSSKYRSRDAEAAMIECSIVSVFILNSGW